MIDLARVDTASTHKSVEDCPLYRDDVLLKRAVKEYGAPLYVFDEATIRRQCATLRQAMRYPNTQLRFACKSLTLRAILRIIHEEGFWVDASSINEVLRAQMAGFQPHEIYYTGEGASLEDYRRLVDNHVLVNCTSLDQMDLLVRAGGTRCSLRINPGEGHGANHRVNTGGPQSKHGIYFDQIDAAKAKAREHGLTIAGVHCHIGSGADLREWLRIQESFLDLAAQFPEIETVNLGGGLPVNYGESSDPDMMLTEWGAAVSDLMDMFSKRMRRTIGLQLEPGRFIVASSGLLLAEVRSVKKTADLFLDNGDIAPGLRFATVNSGLNHNIRPAMYGSFHPIRFIAHSPRPAGIAQDYVVAGYLCESGDLFTVDADGAPKPREFAKIEVGDIMVMAGCGAYSHAMMNDYNSMNRPASILVTQDGEMRLIERRGTLEDSIRREIDLD